MAKLMMRVLALLDDSPHPSERTVTAIGSRLGLRQEDVLETLFHLERTGVVSVDPQHRWDVWRSDRTPQSTGEPMSCAV